MQMLLCMASCALAIETSKTADTVHRDLNCKEDTRTGRHAVELRSLNISKSERSTSSLRGPCRLYKLDVQQ
jgi:hypothetical protein